MSEDRQQEAKRNRGLMPETAKVVDRWRRTFGAGTRFPWVREGDQERGARSTVERSMNADQWLHYVATGETPAAGAAWRD